MKLLRKKGSEPAAASPKGDHNVPCDIGLDLRQSGYLRAVAVSRDGHLKAWAESTEELKEALAGVLKELGVRPRSVRVLLDASWARVVHCAGTHPHDEQIQESLLDEGHEPPHRPAFARVETSSGNWLAAACEEGDLLELADEINRQAQVEPTFRVDQLFWAEIFGDGSLVVEDRGEDGGAVFALPMAAPPFSRTLLPHLTEEDVDLELRKTLDLAGEVERLGWIGLGRRWNRMPLGPSHVEIWQEALPKIEEKSLPEAFEMAWWAANRTSNSDLVSPRLRRRLRSVVWANRVTWLGIAAGVLALAWFTVAAFGWLSGRGMDEKLREEMPIINAQIGKLQEIAVAVQNVQQLRGEIAGQSLPWPGLAPTLTELAKSKTHDVFWQKLHIQDGVLELTIDIERGPEAAAHLQQLREALDLNPGLFNLSWEEVVEQPMAEQNPRLRTSDREVKPPADLQYRRHLFRASLRDPQSSGGASS